MILKTASPTWGKRISYKRPRNRSWWEETAASNMAIEEPESERRNRSGASRQARGRTSAEIFAPCALLSTSVSHLHWTWYERKFSATQPPPRSLLQTTCTLHSDADCKQHCKWPGMASMASVVRETMEQLLHEQSRGIFVTTIGLASREGFPACKHVCAMQQD